MCVYNISVAPNIYTLTCVYTIYTHWQVCIVRYIVHDTLYMIHVCIQNISCPQYIIYNILCTIYLTINCIYTCQISGTCVYNISVVRLHTWEHSNTHTHTHTHVRRLYVPLCEVPFRHTDRHTHTHTHTHIHTYTHKRYTLSVSLSLTHTHTLTLSIASLSVCTCVYVCVYISVHKGIRVWHIHVWCMGTAQYTCNRSPRTHWVREEHIYMYI